MGRRTLKTLGLDKVGLSEGEKRAVKKWLKQPPEIQRRKCPLNTSLGFGASVQCNVCFSWFPRSKKLESCPCTVYQLRTVKKRAREMLEY